MRFGDLVIYDVNLSKFTKVFDSYSFRFHGGYNNQCAITQDQKIVALVYSSDVLLISYDLTKEDERFQIIQQDYWKYYEDSAITYKVSIFAFSIAILTALIW